MKTYLIFFVSPGKHGRHILHLLSSALPHVHFWLSNHLSESIHCGTHSHTGGLAGIHIMTPDPRFPAM